MNALTPYDFRAGRAVVTGAASGIGAAVAHGLAARGSHLVLLDIDETRLDDVASAIRAAHPELDVAVQVVDLADPAAVDGFTAGVLARYDDVTLLVNNAGVALGGTFEQLDLADVEWLLAINLHAPLRLTKAFLPTLRARKGSHIVNVSSVFGLIAPAGQTAYCASKFGLRGFSEALRHELEGDIGLTIVHPGGVRTSIVDSARVAGGIDPTDLEAERESWNRLLTISPAVAADAILEGVRDRRSRVLIGSSAMVPDLMARLFPRTYHRILNRAGIILSRLTTPLSTTPLEPGSWDPIPPDPGTSRIIVDGVGVRYRETGPPDAPAVVLIHGLTRSLADWTPLHALLGDEFRVISLDLPGYGRSEPLDRPHTLANLAAFVERVLDALGVRRPIHLCGNSLGGATALQVAVTDPARVRDLALFNSAGFGAEVTPALRVLGIRPLAPYLLRPSWNGAARAERSLFFDKSLATPERIAYADALNHRPWAAQVLLETGTDLGDVRGIDRRWRDELLGRAADLGLPLLVAWGLDDEILPARHLDSVQTHFPQARTHLFPRCGHLPMLEQPEATANLLRDFWAGH